MAASVAAARSAAGRRVFAAVLAAGLALTAGCASSGGHSGGGLGDLGNLRHWGAADWSHWAQQHLLHNAVAQDLWSPDAMRSAAAPAPTAPPAPATAGPSTPATTATASATASTATATATATAATASPDATGDPSDPPPAAVPAVAEPHPYPAGLAVFGKIFAKSPRGMYVCSGTVVSDPQHPGRSNLVWTAGHCLHGGKGGDWYQNIAFVPDYNAAGAAGDGRQTTLAQVAPLGRWWANSALVAPQWMAEGNDTAGGAVSQYDSGIIRVADPDLPGKSLEEEVGGSVPIWFDAPRDRLTAVTAYGYPAVHPFDGQQLERCDGGHPARLSYDPTRPTMLAIGCTMTAGSSGGGWLATGSDGKPALVSNTSIGPNPAAWLAGPALAEQAQQMFTTMTRLP
ncbi:trypsin-like serine peptidase [Kitasatospora sp. LaBMicrA B282]|uniref:trypsin-like serine peptidase n=1 Tax=Kitasatospora sp. LaBMicrA B282 TaxID=3420949 RepID=UPI003D152D2C